MVGTGLHNFHFGVPLLDLIITKTLRRMGIPKNISKQNGIYPRGHMRTRCTRAI